MKKNIFTICSLFALVFLSSCEKESLLNGQSNGTRILSSNPDEIFVEDKKSDKWISLTEYNKNFSAEKDNQLYSRRMCIVDGKVGEVCAKSDYSTCNSNLFQCITK